MPNEGRRRGKAGRGRLPLGGGMWFSGLVLALILGLAGVILMQPAPLRAVQDRVFDTLLRDRPSPEVGPPVIVVDIGETDDRGDPWGRAATARLVQRLADAGAAVLAFDMVFSGNCGADADNAALAQALERAPVVLGFLLTDTPGPAPLPQAPLALSGGIETALWSAPGAEAPCPAFAKAARALAPVALLGDGDGLIRRVPAAVLVAGQPYAGLAVETLRISQSAPTPILGSGADPWLRLAGQTHLLDRAAEVRLAPSGPALWPERTFAAEQVLSGAVAPDRVDGAIVVIGSSLPRRGGLRSTASSPVQPSVQIHADVIQSLLAGQVPNRPHRLPWLEAGLAALASLAAWGALARLGPVAGLAAGLAPAAIWVGAAAGVTRWAAVMTDPLAPALAVALVAFSALAGKAALTARAERVLRGRMGQVLPAAVIERLALTPELFRLEGELRQVTALFTDIEGFSATTRALGPQALVRVLDRYFAETCAIVLRHGGMVDKIVGDSLHVLFNAPLDQPGHVDAALACAAEMLAATEALRRAPDLASAGLGRTRIGIETGPAVLGDVGYQGKIDYTAHGDAVNLAARLQEANKGLGTSVCVGPAAAALASRPLRPLGEVEIRSFGRLALFTPDPDRPA